MSVSGWGGTTKYIQEALQRKQEQEERERQEALRKEQERLAAIRQAEQKAELQRREELARQQKAQQEAQQRAEQEAGQRALEAQRQQEIEDRNRRAKESQAAKITRDRLNAYQSQSNTPDRPAVSWTSLTQPKQDVDLGPKVNIPIQADRADSGPAQIGAGAIVGGQTAQPRDASRVTISDRLRSGDAYEEPAFPIFSEVPAGVDAYTWANWSQEQRESHLRGLRNVAYNPLPGETVTTRNVRPEGPLTQAEAEAQREAENQEFGGATAPERILSMASSNARRDELIATWNKAKESGLIDPHLAVAWAIAMQEKDDWKESQSWTMMGRLLKRPGEASQIDQDIADQYGLSSTSMTPGVDTPHFLNGLIHAIDDAGPTVIASLGFIENLTSLAKPKDILQNMGPVGRGVAAYLALNDPNFDERRLGEYIGAAQEAFGNLPEQYDATPELRYVPEALVYLSEIMDGKPVELDTKNPSFGEKVKNVTERWTTVAEGAIQDPRGFIGLFGQDFSKQLQRFDALDSLAEQLSESGASTADILRERTPRLVEGEAQLARALARWAAPEGPTVSEAWMHDFLTQEQQVEGLKQQALLAHQAAQALPPGPERTRMEMQAALIAANAIRLQQKSPMEIYYDHMNMGRRLSYGVFLDPLSLVGAGSEALGVLRKIAQRAGWYKVADAIPAIRPVDRIMAQTNRGLGVIPPTASARSIGEFVRTINDGTQATGKIPLARHVSRGAETIFASAAMWAEDAFKMKRSLATTDLRYTHKAIATLAADLETKGDVKALVRGIARNPEKLIQDGIPVAELTDPHSIRIAQSTGGYYPVGWADLDSPRFRKSAKIMQQEGFEEALDHLPSLRGNLADPVDKAEFQRDMANLLGRSAGQAERVDATMGAPYGTVKVELKRGETPGTQRLQWVNDEGAVLKYSDDLASKDAQRALRMAQNGLKELNEWRVNPVMSASNFMRSILSSFALTAPSSIAVNLTSVLAYGLWHTGDVRILNGMLGRTNNVVDYVMAKGGGMLGDIRMLSNKYELASDAFSSGPKGFWGKPVVSRIPVIGPATDVGRRVRQATEEIAYTNAFGTGFRKKWNDGATRVTHLAVKPLVENFVTDPAEAKRIIRTIGNEIRHGNKRSVSALGADLARGQERVTLAGVAPTAAHVLSEEHHKRINEILATVRRSNLRESSQAIEDIIEEAMGFSLTMLHSGNQPKRYYWTDRVKGLEDARIAEELKQSLKAGRISAEEYNQQLANHRAWRAEADKLDKDFAGLIMMTNGDPNQASYIYDVYRELDDVGNNMRVQQDGLQNLVRDLIDSAADDLAAGRITPDQFREAERNAWSMYRADVRDLANVANQEKRLVLNQAQANIASGQLPMTPQRRQSARQMVERLNTTEAEKQWGMVDDITFRRDDPELFTHKMRVRDEIDGKYQAQAFLALQANPTPDAIDEYMSALAWTRRNNGMTASRVRQAEEGLAGLTPNTPEYKAAWKAVREARDEWVVTTEENWQRWNAAAANIMEMRYNQEYAQSLTFRVPGVQKDYRLLHEVPGKKGSYAVLDSASGATRIWTEADGRIPKHVIANLRNAQTNMQRRIAEEIGNLAVQAGLDKTGIAEIDKVLEELAKNPGGDVYKLLRPAIVEEAGAPGRRLVLPVDEADFVIDTLDSAAARMKRILARVAEFNESTKTPLGPEFLTAFNRVLLPQMDNLLSNATQAGYRVGSRMGGDFTNLYHWDAAMSVIGGYALWASRFLRNAFDDLLTKPGIPATIERGRRLRHRENIRTDEPDRNRDQIPGLQIRQEEGRPWWDGKSWRLDVGGYRVMGPEENLGETVYGIRDPADRIIPQVGGMFGRGWADPGVVSRGVELWNTDPSDPDFIINRGLGGLMIASQSLEKIGLGEAWYLSPFYRSLNGDAMEFRGGDLGMILRIAGDAAVLAEEALLERGFPGAGKAMGIVARTLIPAHYSYLVGQTAVGKAYSGAYGRDIQASNRAAQWVQDRAYQDYFGKGPLPEEPAGAAGMYSQARQDTAKERAMRQAIQWILPISVTYERPGERVIRQTRELRPALGYNPEFGAEGSPVGSKEIMNTPYDVVPGMSAQTSLWAITAQDAEKPGEPRPGVNRPGLSAIQSTYYPQREQLYEERSAKLEEVYGLHLAGKITEQEMRDRIDAIYDEYNGNKEKKIVGKLQELENQFPSLALIESRGTSLRGMNPEEAKTHLDRNVYSVARENLAEEKARVDALRPGKYSSSMTKEQKAAWGTQNDIYQAERAKYQAALDAEAQRLMDDPEFAGQVIPGKWVEVDGQVVQVPDPAQAQTDAEQQWMGTPTIMGGRPEQLPTPRTDVATPPRSAPAGTAPTVANIYAGDTGADLVERESNRNKGPNQLASERKIQAEREQTAAEIQARNERAAAAYPEYTGLMAEYDALPSGSQARRDFTTKNPQIRALNMLRYNPNEWQQLESLFGDGIVMAWAMQPAYAEDSSERSDYWRKNPSVFLAHSWINGRPRSFDEDGATDEYKYDFGKDYSKAQEMFGGDIWDIVKQARAMPAYEQGNRANAQLWSDFHDKYPQYKQWRDWWYGNLPAFESSANNTRFYSSYGGWGGGGSWTPSENWNVRGYNTQSYSRRYDAPRAASYADGVIRPRDDWRRYLEDMPSLEGWRRWG